ncbi:MAG TPA: hypothetical protein VN721_09400 [Flavipsychrobacter sp.]|nr:hypothetical protein [Flavipsychrobacter sp.]
MFNNKINYLIPVAIFSTLLIVGLYSCYNDNATKLYPNSNNNSPGSSVTCDTTRTISFSNDVLPIFLQNCALSGCHDEATAQYGFMLDNYAHVFNVVQSGRLVGCITHSNGYIAMPQNANKLPECQIETIIRWINEGTPNN